MRAFPVLCVLLSFTGCFSIAACSMDEPNFGDPSDSGGGAGKSGGDGDGDGDGSGGTTTGDGDGDGSGGKGSGSTGNSSGDGDGDSSGDGDGDGSGSGGGEVDPDSCGDGVQASSEDCDDGNPDDEDGCSAECEVEEGWFCAEADTACVDCSSAEPTLGCPCTALDEQACAGPHQAERLFCDGTLWQGLADCDGDTLCDSDTGSCLAVIAECESTAGGYRYCEGQNTRHTCGPDWVTTETTECAGACENGKCVSPDCGDGILQEATEACDDGNLDPNDGCDEQCVRKPGWYCAAPNELCLDCSSGAAVGCPCVDASYPSGGALAGEKGCNGPAQKLSLECSTTSLLWSVGPVCTAGENCEQSSGQCKTIVSECTGHSAGYTYCAEGDVRHVCDEDLVNTAATSCDGVCSGGACQTPRCGDGKIQSGEACDDGNDTAADGCEPASSSAPCQQSGIVAVDGGTYFTCALLVGGAVRCWGQNTLGQLGVGNTTFYGNKHPREIPLVALPAPAQSIAAKGSNACAVLTSGAIACWGDNGQGQLGQGSNSPAFNATPQTINFGTVADQVAVASGYVCARLTNGQVRCWGTNGGGELGLNTTSALSLSTPAASLAAVSLGGTALQVATTGSAACALLSGGAVRCWGNELSGQLGMGLASGTIIGDNEHPSAAGPLAFRASKLIADLSAGSSHFCGRGQAGPSQCWGSNSKGQLGVSSTTNVGTNTLALSAGADVEFDSADPAVLLTAEGQTTCAITSTEKFVCWGNNAYGQLGLADVETYGATNAQQIWKLSSLLTGNLTPVTIGVGSFHTCAVSENGELRCWGRNGDGQLGLGYVSAGAKDYVGKTAAELPSLLPAVQVFP